MLMLILMSILMLMLMLMRCVLDGVKEKSMGGPIDEAPRPFLGFPAAALILAQLGHIT